jgi:[acyl-carrier-protein] S-malonyltransferase
MWEVGTERPGGMAAIIGITADQIDRICERASNGGVVVPANYNSPGQVVISGDEACVEKACELARSEGAKRTLRLNVSGAFHSPLMQEASDRLISVLRDVKIGDPRIPVVVNYSARPLDKGEALKEALEKQLRSPVLWEQSMKTILGIGSTRFVEVGPGRVLKGILRRIDRDATVHSFDEFSDSSDLSTLLTGDSPPSKHGIRDGPSLP